MNKYKVWIFIEEIDEEDGHNDRFLYSIGKEFVTLEEAKALQQRLKELIRTDADVVPFDPDGPFKWSIKEC